MVALPLEQPCVDDGLRDVDAKLRQDVLVALGEGARAVAQEVESADDAVLVAERNGQLPFDAGDGPPKPRVVVHIVDQYRTLFRDGGPDDALADLQSERPDDLVWISLCVRNVERLRLVVEEVDGEHGKIREPRDQSRNAPQQLVKIENGRDFAPELEQGGDELLMLIVVLIGQGSVAYTRPRGRRPRLTARRLSCSGWTRIAIGRRAARRRPRT